MKTQFQSKIFDYSLELPESQFKGSGPSVIGGRGIKSRFLVDSKSLFSRTRYRSEVGQLFSSRYDPLGCVWGAGRSEKYVHPPGTPLENFRQKITIFGHSRPRDFIRRRWASETKNVFKRALWTLNHLLGCLDDVSHRLWKKNLRLKNRPKVTFSPKSL